ncbi:hypothetical protein BK732_03570 [Bacillus thuringiensis serovar navarrensis]|uniref:Uncharacterized protein n=1 Tax=Bacillus thuringiensis serovar navarrensis TaxID=339658 RepID=A0A243AN44_BACTU|nr:hypothetical protein BK732_03570 [Bacillus thuringiensis serovar navarrensis]
MLYELQYWERKSRRMEFYVLKMVGDRKGLHTRMDEVLKIENDLIIRCLQMIKGKDFFKK